MGLQRSLVTHILFGVIPAGSANFALSQRRQLPFVRSGESENSAEGCSEAGLAYAYGAFADRGDVAGNGKFLRTHGQIETYLKEQAAVIERFVLPCVGSY